MSGGEHTPGPWVVRCNDVLGERAVGDDGVRGTDIYQQGRYRGSVATCYAAEHIDGITLAERDANARLIAAAPELLAAAERVIDGLNARIDHAPGEAVPVFDGIADLHDAIAKARGQ